MADPTTTVKADRNADFTYELAITSDVLDTLIRRGRTSESSQPRPGTCILKMDNSGGEYTPLGATTPLRPMHGIQVIADSQNLFTGFVQRVFLHPSGGKQDMVVTCADWLWILSRTDISLPLMLDVRSDILAQRIADLAEIGELNTNPRFKTDLTGYSDLGGATNTRETDVVMEGPAGLKTVTSGAASGWRYTVPSGLSVGDKITVAVYIKVAAGETAPAGNHVVRVSDDVDTTGSTTTFQSSGEIQRVTVTNTFDGSAAAFYVDLERATAGTDGTFRIGAVHITLYKNAIPRSFDNGQSYFSHIAPRRVNALRAIQEAANNELGGMVYVNGSGTLVFEDRSHRARETASTVSQGTIDETMVDVPYEEDADDLIGLVELHHVMWEVGTAGTVFQLFPVPRAIPPSGTLTLDIDYGAIVRDHVVPVATTDWLCNSNPGGGGVDETGNVTITYDDFGGGGQAVFTNTVARTVWLTTFKVRGTPVRLATDTPQVSYTPSGAPDYASKLRFSYRLQDKRTNVQAYAEYLGDRYVTQRERLPVRLLNGTTAILAEMTDRVISERVTITNDNTAYSAKVNDDYHIESVKHRLSRGKTMMETVWGVVPVDAEMFGLDDADIGLDDAANYPLGP